MELHCINEDCIGQDSDVVFIHGLGGHPFSTWMHSDNQRDSLPYWLAAKLPRARVWTFQYDASPSKFLGSSMPLVDRAKAALDYFSQLGLGKRPIVFVTHSLGGLVIKQMLRNSDERPNSPWSAISIAVKGVVFIATPHHGAACADYLKSFGTILRLNVTMNELTRNSDALRDLNEWFRTYQERVKLPLQVLTETQPTKGVFVVDPASAAGGFSSTDPVPVDADHLSICKPKSLNAPVALTVINFAHDCISSTCPSVTSSVPADLPCTIRVEVNPDECTPDTLALLIEALRRMTKSPTIHLVTARKGSVYIDLATDAETYTKLKKLSSSGELDSILEAVFKHKVSYTLGNPGAILNWEAMHPVFYNGSSGVCRLDCFEGMADIAAYAKSLLPAPVFEWDKATVYVGRYGQRTLYLQTNFRPSPSDIPAKAYTTETYDIPLIVYNLLSSGDESLSAKFSDLYVNRIRFLVDPNLVSPSGQFIVDFQGAQNIRILDRTSGMCPNPAG